MSSLFAHGYLSKYFASIRILRIMWLHKIVRFENESQDVGDLGHTLITIQTAGPRSAIGGAPDS